MPVKKLDKATIIPGNFTGLKPAINKSDPKFSVPKFDPSTFDKKSLELYKLPEFPGGDIVTTTKSGGALGVGGRSSGTLPEFGDVLPYPDYYMFTPFRLPAWNNYEVRPVTCYFDAAATLGRPYYFATDPEVDNNRVRAISVITNSALDLSAWYVNQKAVNMPNITQMADWLLMLRDVDERIIMQIPLACLAQPVTRKNHILAVDFNISTSQSFIINRGAGAPTLPYVVVLLFWICRKRKK